MHAVYLACFFGGLVATVLFAAVGALGGHGAGHLHAGPGGHTGSGHLSSSAAGSGQLPSPPHAGHGVASHASAGHTGHAAASRGVAHAAGGPASALPGWLATAFGWTLSWLSPLTLAAAALWFGGAGLLAENVLAGGLVAVILAIAAALGGAALVRAAMSAFLRAGTAPLHADAVGALGTINAPIRADAAGEVIYTLEGLRRSAAARSIDGRALPRGTAVVIVRRERGIAWVEPLDPLAGVGQVAAPAVHEHLTSPNGGSPR